MRQAMTATPVHSWDMSIMPNIRRRRGNASEHSEQKVLTRPAPTELGTFGCARTIGDFVILEWDTAFGTIGWAHPLKAATPSVRWLADAAYSQFREQMHTAYTALVLPKGSLNLDLAPELEAIDLYSDSRVSGPYEVTWRQLAAVLGAPAPWFHPTLRDRDTIATWKPGMPPAIVPANHIELPTQALVELAADEPDGSPAAAVCLWLARHLRRQDAGYAQQSIDEIRTAAADPDSDCAYVHIAALPAPLLRPEDAQPDEMVRRAGWAQIVERRDVLAAAAAEAVLRWDSGKAWPTGQTAEFDPASCPAATEWTARLRLLAPVRQPPTVLERLLLEHVSNVDQGELLYDDASGCPAVRRTNHLGKVTVYACVPQRISTLAPLTEVVLSRGFTVWIRTSDGGLWLAPALPGRGLSRGYSGGGPCALAALRSRLLDDITGPPVAYEEPPPGLLSLVKPTPQDDTTTYNRTQLLAARAA
jgi:hypothetical protein